MLVKLKDICKITMGQSPKSEFYSNDSGFPFIQGNRTFGNLHPSIDTYTSKVTKIAKKGNVLISVRAPVGDLNLANQDVCIGRGIAALSAMDGDNIFLFNALKANLNNIITNGNGTTYSSITIDILKDITINIPPELESRKKISKIIGSIDNQIERNIDMVNKLQVLGKHIFDCFSSNSPLNINIKNIATLIWGQCPEGENILTYKSNNTIPYASGAGDIDDNKVTVNPKAYTNNSKKIVPSKTICISIAGTIGKIGVIDNPISIGRAMLGLYNPEKYGLIYFSLLKYIIPLKNKASGAIQKIINNNHLDIIDLPELKFEESLVLNKILTIIIKIEKSTQKLITMKENLLPILINGQLY